MKFIRPLLLICLAFMFGCGQTGAEEQTTATAVTHVADETADSEAPLADSVPDSITDAKGEAPAEDTAAVESTADAEKLLDSPAAVQIVDTEDPGYIAMESAYDHKKAIVQFPHTWHAFKFGREDFPMTCGSCHHDADNTPLDDLKLTDAVQSCFECHNKPGELKGKKAKGLTTAEKLAYHANALHKNCLTCHRKFKKQYKVKTAPTTCTKCHPKKK